MTQPSEGLLWYTRARRIPRLIGKLHGSERGLPGGPYTITQIVGGCITFVTMSNTTSIWGQFGLVGNFAVQSVMTVAVTLMLRLVKSGGRDPITAAIALATVWSAPRSGRSRHTRRRFQPETVRARVQVLVPRPADDVLVTELSPQVTIPATATPSPAQVIESVRVSSRPVTNLERLLAGSA